MSESAKVKTCLWFESQAEEAAAFYVSLLPGSAVTTSFRPDPGGPALMVEFELAGTPYQALNGGPMYRLNEAASISVTTEDQAETDRLWEALVAGGGRASRCGWLVDRFGLSWQIVPRSLGRCLAAPDREAAGRAMQAMFQMSKIDIAAIEKAFRGDVVKILRGIVAIVLGWFTGSVANMGLVMLGIALVPPPGIPAELRGFEVMISRQEEFYEALAAALPKFGVLDYLFPFLAHALGTLVGASVAAWLAPIRKARFAWAIGLLFLAGGITNVAMLPAPLWFEAADLILAYLPMAWIAARLVARSEG